MQRNVPGSACCSKPLSPRRIFIYSALFGILAIGGSELLESHLAWNSRILETIVHVMVLGGTLCPILYSFWYKPLMHQIQERYQSEEEVRKLSHRLLATSEDVQSQLARDLHDELGQKLTVLQMHAELLERSPPCKCPPHAPSYHEIGDLVRELSQDLRHVISRLRPRILDEMGIDSALEVHCAEVSSQNRELTVSFFSNGLNGRLDPALETVLFRVCQEALTNVVKHARATEVTVKLTASFPGIILSIQDNGIGFDLADTDRQSGADGNGFGILGMRERISLAGGSVRIHTSPGQGTKVRAELPLAPVRPDRE